MNNLIQEKEELNGLINSIVKTIENDEAPKESKEDFTQLLALVRDVKDQDVKKLIDLISEHFDYLKVSI